MKSKMKIVFAILFLFGVCAHAQNKQLDTVIVKNIGTYNVTISDAKKITESPVNDDTAKVETSFKYSITSKKQHTSFSPDTLKSPKMVNEPLKRLYKYYAKVGFGNYTTPYGELFFNNLRSKDLMYGVHLKHLSSTATLGGKGFSGFSDNEVNLYGKKYIRKHTVSVNSDYIRNVVHSYGYDTTATDFENNFTANFFQNFIFGATVQSHFQDSSSIHHKINAKYFNLIDNHAATENNIFVGADVYTYYSGQKFNISSFVDFYNNRLAFDTTNISLIKIGPSVSLNGKKLRASVGIDLFIETGDKESFHFYPNLEVNYNVIDNIIIPYAGINGGMKRNSYRSLYNENPFITEKASKQNTDTKFNLYAGMRGSLSANTVYNTWASYSKVNNMHFFVNNYSEVLQNRFNVIYDTVTVINLHGELGYTKREKIAVYIKGDYFKYNLTNEIRAWHKPQMQITFSANYNLKDKILVNVDVIVIGKQLATLLPGQTSTLLFNELKGVTDVNLGLEYRYNKKLSGFIRLNNLGMFRYERWQKYPTQRFNFMLGVTAAF
jgi:hypothetical protein